MPIYLIFLIPASCIFFREQHENTTLKNVISTAKDFGLVLSKTEKQSNEFFSSLICVFSHKLAKTSFVSEQFNKKIKNIASLSAVDIIVLPSFFERGTAKLVVLDVDATVIEDEVIDLLAKEAGREKEVAAITVAAMEGAIDFSDSLQKRVANLAGLPVEALEKVFNKIKITSGVAQLLEVGSKHNCVFALISGGFIEIVTPLAKSLGIKYFAANRLEIEVGKLTGKTVGEIVDDNFKAKKLLEYAKQTGFSLQNTIAVGDGFNDLKMLKKAGLGIAFNAKAAVQKEAKAVINIRRLDTILSVIGLENL